MSDTLRCESFRLHVVWVAVLLVAAVLVAGCQRIEPDGRAADEQAIGDLLNRESEMAIAGDLDAKVPIGPVRAQLDTVGFAVSEKDFQAVLAAGLAAEGLSFDRGAESAAAAILPHDDYLYAARTAVHALPYLQAKRWIVFGVCHACRRIGVRDRLLLDDYSAWDMAGTRFPVADDLRAALLAGLGEDAVVARDRHAAEHSIEALLPWLAAAVDKPLFVPILVPGMEPDRMRELADRLATTLAAICRERDWVPGRDLGILISADAVHYGCEGWGARGYAPFGCDEQGHAAARDQDQRLCENLAGPLTVSVPSGFIDAVWDFDHPDYPDYPYKITWCGLYSIPFGLTTTLRWHEELGLPAPTGRVCHYGDSVTDGRLNLPDTRLGVTAPNTLEHWVGYPALAYVP